MPSKKLHRLLILSVPFLFLQVGGWAEERGADRMAPLMLGEGMVPTASLVDYQISALPGQAGGDPTLVDQRQTGRFVVKKTEQDTWSVSERFGHLGIGEPIAIPETDVTTPQDLWSVEGGMGYNHRFANDRDAGVNFNVGSDSDHPFYSIHETVFRATANFRVPSHDHNAWLFFLTYSNNRHFLNNIPLPGFGYYFQADHDRLVGIVGFPFISLRYMPTQGWSLQASVFGPRNLNAEISREVVKGLRAYTAFQWGSQEWMIADRQDTSDRLFFDKKRAALGLRAPLPYRLFLEVSGGRQFDQRFFVNDSSSFKDVPVAGLGPAWFVQTKISYRFAALPGGS